MSKRKPQDTNWESFAEHQIRAAQESGQFDNLPGFGQPLSGIDGPPDQDWWLREKLRREEISALPPALEIQRDVERTLQGLAQLTSEIDVRRELQLLNEKIREAHYNSLRGPPNRTMPVDVETMVAEWKRQRAAKRRS